MIGQHDHRVDRKVMARARRRYRLSQRRDMVDEQALPPLQQVDREEPASARNERATIIRHGRKIADDAVVINWVADYACG